jgi:hypothetical protein
MHQDLNAILDGLRDLEARGVSTLDCRAAQFSADEPIARLRMICQSWKVMFHAEYSSGQPLRMLVDLRNVVDAALARSAKGTLRKPSGAAVPQARAAAASAHAGPAREVTEFEVSAGAQEWDQNASAEHPGSEDDGKN